MSNSSSTTADFVDLWKRSELPLPPNAAAQPISRSNVSERLSGERSVVWTNLSQLRTTDQALMMSKLTMNWPYDQERRAISWSMYAGMFTNCCTAALLSARVNSDMVLLNSRTPFFEAVQRCPKAPFVFGIYSSGVVYYVMQQMTVHSSLFSELEPCPSCILGQSVAIGVTTGIVIPMLSTPYLSYYVLLNRKGGKFPEVKNALDFVMLALEGSRAARPLLMTLIPLQVMVSAACAYASLWGRNRMFATMDADPELAKEVLIKAQSEETMKQKVTSFLRKIPFVSDVIGQQAPEEERVR